MRDLLGEAGVCCAQAGGGNVTSVSHRRRDARGESSFLVRALAEDRTTGAWKGTAGPLIRCDAATHADRMPPFLKSHLRNQHVSLHGYVMILFLKRSRL